jgi:ferredoxin/flavodoxin---NADP+ reductase
MRAVVTERRDLTGDLWIVRLRPDDRLAFRAGQYVSIGLPGQDKLIERPYSIVSSPEEPELEFFFELVPHGELTPRLYEVGTGGEVYLRRAAKGLFLYDHAGAHKHHFMVATVTGVAPYASIVRQFVANARKGAAVPAHITVLEAASLSAELGYDAEFAEYAREFEWLDYIPTVSRPWVDTAWTGERGRAEDVLRKHLDAAGCDPADTTAYLCGHPQMVANGQGILARAGIPAKSIKSELFWVSTQKAGEA